MSNYEPQEETEHPEEGVRPRFSICPRCQRVIFVERDAVQTECPGCGYHYSLTHAPDVVQLVCIKGHLIFLNLN